MIPGIGATGLPELQPRPGQSDAAAAAQAFEAYFLRQIFSEFRKANEGGMLSGGFAGATFQEMLDGALADAMAASEGVGLRALVERELGGQATPAEHPTTLTTAPLPGPARTSSAFGPRAHPLDGHAHFHTGVDLAASENTPVRSSSGGTVVHAGPAGGYGNLVVIDHGDGRETRYAHLRAIEVTPGSSVAAGQVIGRVGMTGSASGPHLHFEVRDGGRPVDPVTVVPGLQTWKLRSNQRKEP